MPLKRTGKSKLTKTDVKTASAEAKPIPAETPATDVAAAPASPVAEPAKPKLELDIPDSPFKEATDERAEPAPVVETSTESAPVADPEPAEQANPDNTPPATIAGDPAAETSPFATEEEQPVVAEKPEPQAEEPAPLEVTAETNAPAVSETAESEPVEEALAPPVQPESPKIDPNQFGTSIDASMGENADEKLPWEVANDAEPAAGVSGWDLGDEIVPKEKSAPIDSAPATTEPVKPTPATESEQAPVAPNPWLENEKLTENDSKLPPPELPTSAPTVGGSVLAPQQLARFGLGVAGLVIVGFVGYLLFFKNNEKTTEMLARWTGAYNEISQEVPPGERQVQVVTEEPTPAIDEGEVMALVGNESLTPPDNELSPLEEAAQNVTTADAAGNALGADSGELIFELSQTDPVETETEIAILPPPDAALEPAEPAEQLSMAERLQRALQEARAERRQQAVTDETIPALEPADQRRRDMDRQRQLEEELAEYRRALASAQDASELPTPGDFFRRDGQQQQTATQQLYQPNPNNLPIVNEPRNQRNPQIRGLEDFDVDEFTPPTRRVQIPRGIAPSLNAAEFPELELLSLVPDRGLLAIRGGVKGVLMIGEAVAGWELIEVAEEYAEFQNNGRRHVLTLQPEIRSSDLTGHTARGRSFN